MSSIRFCATILSTSAWIGVPVQADTFVVDDDGGPGVDFPTIQPAVDAASHGDLILVLPGSYPGFTLDTGLTILGAAPDDQPLVTGPVVVSDIAAPLRATLSTLRMVDLTVSNIGGHVTLDLLELSPNSPDEEALALLDCQDVRAYQCSVHCPDDSGQTAVWVSSSRVELIECTLEGGGGVLSPAGTSDGDDGGHGIYLEEDCFAAVFSSDSAGGAGTDNLYGYSCPSFGWHYGGDGGHAASLKTANRLVVAGPPTRVFPWSSGGVGCPDVPEDGERGRPIHAFPLGGNQARASGVTLGPPIPSGSFLTLPALPDPFLERFGTLQAGRQQTFWIQGTPGDSAVLYLGRAPEITVDTSQEMDDLISHERTLSLGPIPATGRLSFTFTIPAFLPRGFTFFAQAATIAPGGQRLTTNSIPILLRQ